MENSGFFSDFWCKKLKFWGIFRIFSDSGEKLAILSIFRFHFQKKIRRILGENCRFSDGKKLKKGIFPNFYSKNWQFPVKIVEKSEILAKNWIFSQFSSIFPIFRSFSGQFFKILTFFSSFFSISSRFLSHFQSILFDFFKFWVIFSHFPSIFRFFGHFHTIFVDIAWFLGYFPSIFDVFFRNFNLFQPVFINFFEFLALFSQFPSIFPLFRRFSVNFCRFSRFLDHFQSILTHFSKFCVIFHRFLGKNSPINLFFQWIHLFFVHFIPWSWFFSDNRLSWWFTGN